MARRTKGRFWRGMVLGGIAAAAYAYWNAPASGETTRARLRESIEGLMADSTEMTGRMDQWREPAIPDQPMTATLPGQPEIDVLAEGEGI